MLVVTIEDFELSQMEDNPRAEDVSLLVAEVKRLREIVDRTEELLDAEEIERIGKCIADSCTDVKYGLRSALSDLEELGSQAGDIAKKWAVKKADKVPA